MTGTFSFGKGLGLRRTLAADPGFPVLRMLSHADCLAPYSGGPLGSDTLILTCYKHFSKISIKFIKKKKKKKTHFSSPEAVPKSSQAWPSGSHTSARPRPPQPACRELLLGEKVLHVAAQRQCGVVSLLSASPASAQVGSVGVQLPGTRALLGSGSFEEEQACGCL